MTTTILFYILGTVTGMMFFSMLRAKSRYRKVKSKYDDILTENKELKEFRSEKQSKKRRAKYKSNGWYKVKDKDDPNHAIWSVVYDLREVAQSQDGSKFQFEILDVFSENTDDSDMESYINHFKSKSGGGWLEEGDFEWITTTSKEEQRDDKLEQLGI